MGFEFAYKGVGSDIPIISLDSYTCIVVQDKVTYLSHGNEKSHNYGYYAIL